MTRKRCGVAILPPTGGRTTPLWQGTCRNAPLRGFAHCRHHLTPNERARRYALSLGITADQAIANLKAVFHADD